MPSAAPRPEQEHSTVADVSAGTGSPAGEPSGPPRATEPEGVPRPRRRCGRYELLEPIGRGGFGSVYRAWDPQHQREVAIKLLIDPDERSRARFQREIKATARLRHPNVVALLDSGEQDGRPFLVMELVRGRTLYELCCLAEGDDRPPRRAVVEAVRDVAQAVAYAHGEGVLHRDLKPENVLVDEAGRTRVVDLGLARLRGDARLTGSGEMMGTPAYMPPEQAGAFGGRVDERSDVYSLGATLYTALTGACPFEAETGMELFLAVLREEPESPRELDPSVPEDLETICLRCLEKEPEARYASAAEVAAELERWLEGEPIAARPLGGAGRARRWALRHRVPLLAAAGGVVVGLLAGLLPLILLGEPRPPHDPDTATLSARPEADLPSSENLAAQLEPELPRGNPEMKAGNQDPAKKAHPDVRDDAEIGSPDGDPSAKGEFLSQPAGETSIRRARGEGKQAAAPLEAGPQEALLATLDGDPQPATESADAPPSSSSSSAPRQSHPAATASPTSPNPGVETSGGPPQPLIAGLLALLVAIGLGWRLRVAQEAEARAALARWKAGRQLPE